MRNMTLKNITRALRGNYFGKEKNLSIEITDISIDSRKIREGSLFIPIKGQRADGHDYIESTLKNGALCSLSEKKLPKELEPYILVDSTLQAIKDLAEYYRMQLDIKVIGITGSVGKTSTKEMIASVLEQKYKVLKTKGNFNNEIGLPLTIFSITEEHEIAVVEMGISDFGEMHRLSKAARPDICVITNIGCCHLENLKDLKGVLKAKSEIFDFISEKGSVVLNGDDPLLSEIETIKGISPIFYGLGKENQITAENIQNKGLKGNSCTITHPEGSFEVLVPVPGNHMVYNALAAVAAGRLCGLSDTQIKKGIESMETISGRFHIIEAEAFTIIDDCYNANPVSMRASLDVLAQASGRKVCILGDMFELGLEEKKLHEETGRYAGEKKIDVIFCVGELSSHMARGARSSMENSSVYYFSSKEELLKEINKYLKKEDTILIKASHAMEFEKLTQYLKKIKINEIS